MTVVCGSGVVSGIQQRTGWMRGLCSGVRECVTVSGPVQFCPERKTIL